MLGSLSNAKSGLLFKIAESGAPASADIILCLNGKGALSCQNYHVSAQSLALSTVARHDYPAAGIKVLTPGFEVTGCTPYYPNGYCLFAVNLQTPTTILLNGTTPIPSKHTLGGTISGLIGSVSLQNNGGDTLTQNNDGNFTFGTPVAQGASYQVTVSSQPTTQTCTVNNGTGTMGGSNVTNVDVNCVTNTTTLSTSISQLALSVTGLTEYGVSGTPASGLARIITITNTGSNPATNLTVTAPAWPTGTTHSTTCAPTLSAGSSCMITVTPIPVPLELRLFRAHFK